MIDYQQKFRLDKKTAFVIGGLGLIGREVSTAFASAEASTIILDLDGKNREVLEKKLGKEGYEVHFRSFDCSDMENLGDNFSRQLDEFGTPDVFINCSYPRTDDWESSSFKDVTLASYRENVDIHMNSYAWLARMASEAMKEAGKGGSLIQLGSIYGILGQDLTVYEGTEMHENMTYSVIKGGITNLTRQMASYYGRYGVRVNSICSGGLRGHVAGRSNFQEKQFIKNYEKKVPLKRLGNPEEVANVITFIASDASSYINGSNILVDGGWTII